jgi:hypothetical protein
MAGASATSRAGRSRPTRSVRCSNRRARGELVITDPALEVPFWRYYTDDARHQLYPRGSAREAQVFATPPWQAAPAATSPR